MRERDKINYAQAEARFNCGLMSRKAFEAYELEWIRVNGPIYKRKAGPTHLLRSLDGSAPNQHQNRRSH